VNLDGKLDGRATGMAPARPRGMLLSRAWRDRPSSIGQQLSEWLDRILNCPSPMQESGTSPGGGSVIMRVDTAGSYALETEGLSVVCDPGVPDFERPPETVCSVAATPKTRRRSQRQLQVRDRFSPSNATACTWVDDAFTGTTVGTTRWWDFDGRTVTPAAGTRYEVLVSAQPSMNAGRLLLVESQSRQHVRRGWRPYLLVWIQAVWSVQCDRKWREHGGYASRATERRGAKSREPPRCRRNVYGVEQHPDSREHRSRLPVGE